MPKTEKAPAPTSASPKACVTVEEVQDEPLCTCCEPQNPLVMRPDLGTMTNGSARFALCVLHEPEPVVYCNRGDGTFVRERKLVLNAAGEIADESGKVVAQVAEGGFQRLSTLDDDDEVPPVATEPAGDSTERVSKPQVAHVDLSQDDFY